MRWLALPTAVLLAACSTTGTQVVLLPQPDGTPSAVTVASRYGSQTLSEPYERATALRDAKAAPAIDKADPAELRRQNKALFDLMPPPAQLYTVYFEAGGSVLTSASQVTLTEALNAALARSGGEIVVTGYTDTVGTVARNDALSLERAEQVRQLFLQRNFPPERIAAVGRGKRELAVKTADEVDEPRNRRVTIQVK